MKWTKDKGAKPVYTFLRKIAEKEWKKDNPTVTAPAKQCLLELQAYIREIVRDNVGIKFYDDLTTAKWIYKTALKPAEERRFSEVNLWYAAKALDDLINTISGETGGLNYKNIYVFRRMLRDILFDLRPFVEYFMQQKDPGYVFLRGGKNYTISTAETFHVARGLYYWTAAKDYDIPHKESQGMVSMVVRQSIEMKTKRVLAVNKITKIQNGWDYPFKDLFRFIQQNKALLEYDPVNFEIVKLIYKWACAYIHNGEIPRQWQNHFALLYMEKWFKAGTYRGRKMTVRSVFAAFKIKNLSKLKEALVNFVGKDYKIEFVSDHKIEAILIEKY